MYEESAEAQVEDGRRGTYESQSQRHLREALAAAEKFKYKFQLEQQVSSELARRCDECRQIHTDDMALINKLERELEKLVKIGYNGSDTLSVTIRRNDASIVCTGLIAKVPYDYSTRRESLLKAISENDSVRVNESQPQRRLRKAVAVVEKFKFKYCQEKKISAELARECDNLMIKHSEDRVVIDSIEKELKRLIRLGYKGIGPVTAHSSAISTPSRASSLSKKMITRSSDSSSATTDTDISADVSVDDSGELSKKCNQIENDSERIYDCNLRIESKTTNGRFLNVESYIEGNNETKNHPEIRERMRKEINEFADFPEEINEMRDIGDEVEKEFFVRRRMELLSNRKEVLESNILRVKDTKKENKSTNGEEIERLKEIQNEIERETAIKSEMLEAIEYELERKLAKEDIERERLKDIEIDSQIAMKTERLKAIERENAIETERLKKIGRDNARETERLKKIERDNAMETDRLKKIGRDNARETERLKATERDNIREMERLKAIERVNMMEKERLKKIERDNARETERLREVERDYMRETERLKERERDNAIEMERLKEIHTMNQTEILHGAQLQMEQITMPQFTPVILAATTNTSKDTVATSTFLSSMVPRSPFEATESHPKAEDGITDSDESGRQRQKVRNIEIMEEEVFVAPQFLSSSACSQSQPTLRPIAAPVAAVTSSVDIISGDRGPDSISRPPALSVCKEPSIKLFEHFLMVGASPQNGSNLAANLLRQDTHGTRVDGVEDVKSSSRMTLIRRIGSLIASTPYSFAPSPRPPASDKMDKNSVHGQPVKTIASPSICSLTQGSSSQGMESSTSTTPTNSSRVSRRHSVSTVSPPSSPTTSSFKGSVRSSSINFTSQSISKGQQSASRSVETWEGESRPAFKSRTTPANILYQFMDPSSSVVQRPPVEVSDFCLPLGGLLSSLAPTQTTAPGFHDGADRSSDGMPSYTDGSYNHNRDLILKVHTDKAYHSCKRYSNDCFIFVLDDKTVKTTKIEPCVQNDEHVASPGNRLYGICVQQARKLSVPVCTISNALSSSADMEDIQRALDVCSTDRDEDEMDSPRSFAFESKVCFTILSRFPLFDFFFEIIQQIIHLDEEDRWKESMTGRKRKNKEGYIPTGLLNEVIGRLMKLPAPHYGASLSFNVRLGRSMTVHGLRLSPSSHAKIVLNGGEMVQTAIPSGPGTDWEHHHMSGLWSLSVLLSPVALPVELLVRLLGLMLCEAKLVILGTDLCLVSAIIMGLQTLIMPLEWVAPAISILPLKLAEFVECPVPLLAGLIVEPTEMKTFCPPQTSRSVANSPCANSSKRPSRSFHFSPVKVEIPDSTGQREAAGSSTTLQSACLRAAKLLKRCGENMSNRDSGEEGMLSAVLDSDERELFLCGRYTSDMSRELVMPCAQLLVDRIKACLSEAASCHQRYSSSEKTYHGKVEKMAQGEEEKRIISKVRSIVTDHVRWVISLCIGGDATQRVADAEFKSTSTNLRHACPASAAHASTFDEVMSVAMDDCNISDGPDLSDSESDNELAESYTRSPPVFHRESSTVLERRRMKGVQATGETLIIEIPRNASTSSTSTTNSSKESRMYADDGHHHRNTASTHGLTLKRSLKKMISKHNLSQAVPNSPFSSSSGSSKSKGRYTTGPSDTKKGAMSVLLMSQQVSLEGNTAAFLNRFASTQMYAEYAESDTSHSVNIKSYETAASIPPPPRPSLIDPFALHTKGSFSKKLGRCLSNGFSQTINVRRGSVVYYSDTSDDEGQISGAEFNYDDDSDDDERNSKHP